MPIHSAASSSTTREADIHDGEGDLEDQPVGRVLAVLGDVLVGQPHELEDFRVHRPRDEQVGVVVAAQLDHRADEIGAARRDQRRDALHHVLGQPVGHAAASVPCALICARISVSPSRVDQRGEGQRARDGERGQDALELVAVGLEGAARLLELARRPR